MRKDSFKKEERLKKRAEITKVFDNGLRIRGRYITLFLLKRVSPGQCNRAAFTASKRQYGKKTVLRNRFRRVLREAYRKTKHLLPAGYDIVILASNIKEFTKSTTIERDLSDVFQKSHKK